MGKPKRIPSQMAGVGGKAVHIMGDMSAAAVVGAILLILYGVFMRYLLNNPSIFVDEISSYLLVLIVFFGVARTFGVGGHIRVELVVNRLPTKIRQWLRGITLLLGIGYGLILTWQAWNLVVSSRGFALKSFFLRVPAYIPQLLIVVGALALTLVLMGALAKHWQQLRHSRGPEGQ